MLHAAEAGKKLLRSLTLQTLILQTGLVNWAEYDCISRTAPGQGNCFFQRGGSSARGLGGGTSRLATGIFADDFVFGRFRNSIRLQREIDNLRPDPGAIAQRNPNARFPARAHALYRNRIFT